MVLFKAEITTTPEDIKELVFFTQVIKKWWVRPLMILLMILSVFLLTIGFFNIIPIWSGITVLLLTICYISGCFINVKRLTKQSIRSGTVALSNKRTLTFHNDSLELSGGRTNTYVKKSWDTIYEAFERKNCYIIYITITTAFVIHKSQLDLQQRYELSDCLIKSLGHRYHKIIIN